ncbi:hypothetical protein OAL13_00210 [bacterium]|nr:hypothetical protein [bacterium]
MTATISSIDLYFSSLAAQHEQATELTLQGHALHNDVTAQLVEQLQSSLAYDDVQNIRDLNDFMVNVMWDCGDDFALEPHGVLHLMRFYDRDFTAAQIAFVERLLSR